MFVLKNPFKEQPLNLAWKGLYNSNSDWGFLLHSEFNAPYFEELNRFLDDELKNSVYTCPYYYDIFNAFSQCEYKDTKVVILGQDPYPTRGQADGLAFSVMPSGLYNTTSSDAPMPPTIKNILRELYSDMNINKTRTVLPSLVSWAHQGVLLLNTKLTVREGVPGSHKGKGWEKFTKAVIDLINAKKNRVVFILWGSDAQEYEKHVDTSKHVIIKSAHPSPLSARKGFFFSRPFSRTNAYLQESGQAKIHWFDIEAASPYFQVWSPEIERKRRSGEE